MNESQRSESRWRRIPPLRWIVAGALVALALLWLASTVGKGLADIEFEGLAHPYLVLFGFVASDAIIPIFPSESLLNTASTLAAGADSNIEIWRLVVAGAVGATVGDTVLYWVSRTLLRGFMEERVAQVEQNEKVAQALQVLSGQAAGLIVFGRFVPGLRFVVGATMGLTRFSYPRFLLWNAIGGTFWAAFTCISSYLVASAFDDRPILSMGVSVVITTALLAVFFKSLKNTWDEGTGSSPGSAESTTPAT